MAKLVYAMITSLDGYAASKADDEGRDGDGGAEDEEVHTFIGERFRDVGTYLYGRRIYETMLFWETVHLQPDVPPHILDFARDWRAAEKVVYSTTLESASSERTRIERRFDPDAVRRLKADSPNDLTVNGPTLAAEAIRAGLVDEYHLFTTTSVVGRGIPFFPAEVRLDLELVEQRVFGNGTIYAHYRPR
ncbi:dihydrofolate reductase family protein [soil metagenome]